MKSFHRLPQLCVALALAGFAFVASAQEKETAPPPPAAPAAPEAPAEPAPTVEREREQPLRRLDRPETDENRSAADLIRERTEEMRKRTKERVSEERARASERRRRHTGSQIFELFGNAELGEGEQADVVLAIFGNATAKGEVGEDVVAIFGNSTATGPSVGDTVFAACGNVYVNSHVNEVIGILGNVELGPKAIVDGEVFCVGGHLIRDKDAVVRHQIHHLGNGFSLGPRVTAWINECLAKGRPLGFGPVLSWAWLVAFGFLGFYLVLALIFPAAVTRCVDVFETRPGYSILTAICTVVLAPIVIVLLCITVVGLVVVPFLGMGLIIASLFGKVVMLAWLGRRFTRLLGDGPLAHPMFGVLIGGLVVMALYTLPVVGFLTYKLLGWIGIGVVVYALMNTTRREKPVVAPVVGTPGAATVAAMAAANPFVAPSVAAAPTTPAPSAVPAATPAPAASVQQPPPVAPTISAGTHPRAGFWIRFWALALDGILILFILLFWNGMMPRGLRFDMPIAVLPVLGIYGACLWKTRGTTIGGVVCGLKVVRIDDREIDWPTAIVRALSCFLSLIVAGLGFIWVAVDNDKQSWHDKIAGTTVVHVPKGTSLI